VAGVAANAFTKVGTLANVGANVIAGGVTSKLSGGKFKDGAFLSALTSGARYLYNKVVEYDITLKGGDKAYSKTLKTKPIKGAINIGTANKIVDPNSLWVEGGHVSRFANNIPGINAISGFHDFMQNSFYAVGGTKLRTWLSVPGMPIAGAITYTGALADPVMAGYLATDRD